MNRLLIAAPSRRIGQFASEILLEQGLDARVIQASSDTVVDVVLRELGEDMGVVVARGYQARLLRARTKLPVVDIVLSGQDMASLLERACRMLDHARPRVAFVGFRSMFSSCDIFARILGADVNLFCAEEGDEIPRMVDQAAAEGYELVIGGELACAQAERVGLRFLFMDSMKESVAAAIATAARMLDAMRREQQHANDFAAVLNYSFDAMLKLDSQARIESANYMAERVFRLSAEALRGKPFFEMPGLQITSVLEDAVAQRRSLYSTIIRIGSDSFVANVAALTADGRHDGFIISMREFGAIEELQNTVQQDRAASSYKAATHFGHYVPRTPLLAEMLEDAKQYAQYDMSILLVGERGLPKESIAECIHNASLRHKGPFVRVDISALSPEFQAEYLFGSGESNSRGLIDRAQNGTIFLLDVDMLTKESQHQLLNVIRNGQYNSVGSPVSHPTSVRVICSTFKVLHDECAQGRYLETLANTLDCYKLYVPALRETPDDIPGILTRVLDSLAGKYKKHLLLTEDAIDLLMHYSWPGNMREVNVFCEKVYILARDSVIDAAFIRDRLKLQPDRVEGPDAVYVVNDPEERQLRAALHDAGHNRQKAAELLGISRSTLWRRMRKYGLT